MDRNKSIFSDKKEAWDIIIALTVILITSLFIYKKVFPETLQNKEFSIADKVVSKDSTGDLFTSLDTKTTENTEMYVLETKPEIVANTLELEENNIIDFKDDENVNLESFSISKLFSFGKKAEKQNENVNSVKNADRDFNKNIETKGDNKELKNEINPEKGNDIKESNIINSTERKGKLVIEDTKPITNTLEKQVSPKNHSNVKESFNTDCVIVVGVFRESNNSNKVKEDIANLGYNHVEGSLRNGLTYVGVPVLCNNKTEKQQIMNTLNTKFNVSTWLKKVSN